MGCTYFTRLVNKGQIRVNPVDGKIHAIQLSNKPFMKVFGAGLYLFKKRKSLTLCEGSDKFKFHGIAAYIANKNDVIKYK